jgi:hypothetical protein
VIARTRRAAPAFACALCLACLPQRGAALDELQLSLDALQAPGWSSGPIQVQLHADAAGALGLRVQARELVLPASLQAVRAATLECAAARAAGTAVHCPEARLTLELDGAQRISIAAVVDFDPGAGSLRVRAARQSVAGGGLTLRLELLRGALSLDTRIDAMHAPMLQAALAGALPIAVSEGTISGDLTLQLAPASGTVHAALDVTGLAFSDAAGLHAGEDVDASLMLDARRRGAGWKFQAHAAMRAGTVFATPMLLEATAQPLQARTEGEWIPGERLHLAQIALSGPGAAAITGTLEAALAPQPRLDALAFTLPRSDADALYRRYLRPFAGSGPLSDLTLSGELSLALDWRAGAAAHAQLTLFDVDVGDVAGGFAVLGLDGALHWTRQRAVQPSRLAWEDLQIRSVAFGAGAMDAQLDGRALRLLAPVQMPLLDGRVRLERLQASALGLAEQRVEADLSLTPVSLQRLSERLGWLPLAGSISGDIPRLVYSADRLAVEGDIRMQLFGGRATLSGVQLEGPFDVVPRLRASARLHDIDLAVLTRAMSFGSIEGRLEGRIDGLVLENWQPVAFDAALRTPEDDASRHRISQRAVDNLASLGGANAVLSSTFLRFFEEFSYERLGLSCRLRAGVCEMGGVGSADRGYYIVKGGGLPPRVDVIGFNDRVDWATLLERLRAVASSPGPVVR